MRTWFRIATPSIIVGLLAGCSGLDTQQENLSSVQQAANVCDETVPTNRFVDGIPAYAQCATTTGAIYSNNGVDTATTSGGTDWIRTQFSGGYQCTELAHRYLYFHWNVNWIPNGDAGTWCDTTPPTTSGVVQTTTPVHGDLIVFPPGSCGADATTGHVALVDVVVNSTTVTIVEQNSAGRRNTAISCAKCFLHVSANTGSGGSGGASGTGGGTSVAGAAATGGVAGPGGARATGGTKAAGGSAQGTGGVSDSTGGTTNPGNPTAGVPATAGTNAMISSPGGTSADSTDTSTGSPGKDTEEGSCSCRVPRHDSRTPVLASLGLLGLMVMRARKRQRDSAASAAIHQN